MLERGLPPATSGGDGQASDILVGHDLRDDAAVVRPVGGGRGLVLTCDVITPIVDDPRMFGRIAAANALSDVYAMGGVPRYALNLVFFPDSLLPLHVLEAVLAGAGEACSEAGAAVVGGHSVRDPEIKFGLSVTGEVELDRIWANNRGRAGQVLVLTKALGTGLVAGARKRHAAGEVPEVVGAKDLAIATQSMATLNRIARDVAVDFPVTAATDITGFGLLGHLGNIAAGSRLCARVSLAALPALPGALGAASHGIIPGGSRANLDFMHQNGTLRLEAQGPEQETNPRLWLAADAQTSGGLLFCVDVSAWKSLVAELLAQGVAATAIGVLEVGEPGVVVVTP